MIPIETKYLKPRSYFILLALLPVAVYFYIALAVSGRETHVWIVGILISLVPLGLFFYHLKSYVLLDNDGITTKTPFRESMIRWNDISRSYMETRFTGRSSKRYWYFEQEKGKRVSFATGMYSRRSLRDIAEALVTRCPKADIEPRIINISQGKFPWYIL